MIMFRMVQRIMHVSGLKCMAEDVFFTEGNILKRNHEPLINGVEGNSFWFTGEDIYFFDVDGGKFLHKRGVNYEIQQPFFIGTEQYGEIFCRASFRRENKRWQWQVGIFNLEKLLVIKNLPMQNYTVKVTAGEVGIGYDDQTKISGFNIDEGKIIWQLDLNDFYDAETKEYLGIFNKDLLVACTNHLLASVDIHTGKVSRTWQALPGFDEGPPYQGVLPEPTDFVLDPEAGKLLGVFSKYYFEIDLISGEISYEDIRQEMARHDVNSFRRMRKENAFTKDHLFVTGHADADDRPNVDLDCVMALNRHTRKIDWVHIFKDTGLGTNVPQITSTHLYQLDTEQQLYIFERVS